MGARDAFSTGSSGVSMEVFDPSSTVLTLAVGRFTNNIIFSGAAAPTVAFRETTNQALDPALFHNNALYSLIGMPATYLDDRLGGLLVQLRENVDYEDSILVVTGDHGEEFREHGRFAHSQVYDETLRVPLMIKLPHSARCGATGERWG